MTRGTPYSQPLQVTPESEYFPLRSTIYPPGMPINGYADTFVKQKGNTNTLSLPVFALEKYILILLIKQTIWKS